MRNASRAALNPPLGASFTFTTSQAPAAAAARTSSAELTDSSAASGTSQRIAALSETDAPEGWFLRVLLRWLWCQESRKLFRQQPFFTNADKKTRGNRCSKHQDDRNVCSLNATRVSRWE